MTGLVACAHQPSRPTVVDEAAPFLIGCEDVVEVSVYRDADLTRTVPVRPDGLISLPMVGEVLAAGRTPAELRDEIAGRLGGIVQSPTVVSVIVREINSARYYVLGEVMRPGAFPLRGEVGVLQGIAAAGGPGEFSARGRIELLRAGSNERLMLDLDALERGESSVLLHPGDTVVVR